MRHFLVTAKHKVPAYSFDRHPVRVSRDSRYGTFYANAARLGCSKNYKTERDAIYALFQDHACYAIEIEEVHEDA